MIGPTLGGAHNEKSDSIGGFDVFVGNPLWDKIQP